MSNKEKEKNAYNNHPLIVINLTDETHETFLDLVEHKKCFSIQILF